jgi:hypothetical protein
MFNQWYTWKVMVWFKINDIWVIFILNKIVILDFLIFLIHILDNLGISHFNFRSWSVRELISKTEHAYILLIFHSLNLLFHLFDIFFFDCLIYNELRYVISVHLIIKLIWSEFFRALNECLILQIWLIFFVGSTVLDLIKFFIKLIFLFDFLILLF